MVFYKGFSTINTDRRWKLTDIELVKRDILNHFHTHKGERVMNPNFGSIVWDLLFEGFTDDTRQLIMSDSITIINSEPRVKMVGLTVNEYEHGIQLLFDLTFLPQNLTEKMYMNYNRQVSKMTSY